MTTLSVIMSKITIINCYRRALILLLCSENNVWKIELTAQLCLHSHWWRSWHKILAYQILVLGRQQNPKPVIIYDSKVTAKVSMNCTIEVSIITK